MKTTLTVNRNENGHRIATNRNEFKKYAAEIEMLLDNDETEGQSVMIKSIKSNFAGLIVTIEVKGQDSNSILKEAQKVLLGEWIDYFDPEDYTAEEAANIFCREMPIYAEFKEELAEMISKARINQKHDLSWLMGAISS